MKTMRLLCCFLIGLTPLSTPVWPSASAQSAKGQEKINVAEFLRECREASLKKIEESRRQFGNYTFKSRKTRREQSKDGVGKEHYEVFEVYPLPFRKRHGGGGFKNSVLIEKDGKPVSAERVEDRFWFFRTGRMNAVRYPKALLWLREDFLLEQFDYKLYKVDSEKEKLPVPEKK